MPSTAQILGTRAEQLIDQYLQKLSWIVLDRNFRTRRGELDRVALDGRSLVFIEIKFRRRADHFQDFSPILSRQRERIILSARYYLWKNQDFLDSEFEIEEYRFDYIYVCGESVIAHHKNLLLGEPMRTF